MAIYPGYDYHWWRLDQTRGRWSHKLASGPAQDTDDQNQPITNPLASGRFGYTDNGGFYCKCGSKAHIAGSSCSGALSVAAAAPSSDGQAVYSVVLDAFSGRPNPVFALSAVETQALSMFLIGMCSTTSAAAAVQAYPSKFLGYRGASVYRSAPGAEGNPSVRFARGTARVFANNPPDDCKQAMGRGDQDFADANQTIERYLIDVAYKKGAINELEYVVFERVRLRKDALGHEPEDWRE